jgi:YVTN family beta-propeller protein
MHVHLRKVFAWRSSLLFALVLVWTGALAPAFAQGPHEPAKPGVPAVKRPMSELHAAATFHAQGMPDWMAVTGDSVWVTSSRAGVVTQLNAATNAVGRTIAVAKPCSGLVFAYESLWIPSCGDHVLVRADPATGNIVARVAAGPADSEGGVTAGAGSVWIVTDAKGTLTRVDAATNSVQARIAIASGSYNPLFADGYVWVSSHDHDALIKVDPLTNQVIATVAIGKGPRFLTFGAGSVWTLNQGDGTISRVDTSSGKLVATIDAGVPGSGGEMAFGFDAVWATMMGFPITRVDPRTNKVTAQWAGAGGDSIRTGFGSVWLTDLMHGTIWRFAPPGQ